MLLSLDSFSIVLAISITILFFPSTTPFCWGVSVTEKCLLIPLSSQYLLNYLETNSPQLSDLKHLIFMSISFSVNSLNNWKQLNVSDFFFNRNIQFMWVMSSTNNKKYISPFNHVVLIGPQTSVLRKIYELILLKHFRLYLDKVK